MESVKIKTTLGLYLAQASNIQNGLEVFVPYDQEKHEKLVTLSLSKKWQLYFEKLQSQVDEFFQGRRDHFDIKLNPQGSSFQKNVWKQLLQIPYGETASYQDIARLIGNEKASRSVGTANGRNPIHIIIPCHRVVRKNGDLGGYSAGLDRKKILLKIEANL